MNYTPLDLPENIPIAFARAWNRRDADGIAALFDRAQLGCRARNGNQRS
ncbi:MAG: hypothetical protein JSS28_06390 [Proteobacteria bacterium]|nr:hypothetical protein [Pseudomonadota bacterium]